MFLVIPSIFFLSGERLWILIQINKVRFEFQIYFSVSYTLTRRPSLQNRGKCPTKQNHLLVGVHLGGVGPRGDVVLDRALDGGHGDVGNARVVEPALELVPLGVVGHVVVQVDLG